MVITKIVGCARCGETHENLLAKKFERPIAPADTKVSWNFWTTCPTNGDPIVIYLLDENQTKATAVTVPPGSPAPSPETNG